MTFSTHKTTREQKNNARVRKREQTAGWVAGASGRAQQWGAGAKARAARRQPLTSAGGTRNQRQFPWLPGGKPTEPNLEQARARWPLVAHLMRRGPLWRTTTANRSGENLGPTQPVGRAPTVRENARVSHPSAAAAEALVSMMPVSEGAPPPPRPTPGRPRHPHSQRALDRTCWGRRSRGALESSRFERVAPLHPASSQGDALCWCFSLPRCIFFTLSRRIVLQCVCCLFPSLGRRVFRRQSIRPDALSREIALPPPVERCGQVHARQQLCAVLMRTRLLSPVQKTRDTLPGLRSARAPAVCFLLLFFNR